VDVVFLNSVAQYIAEHQAVLWAVIVWSVVWKGIALWHAARGRQLAWYIALLVLNTVGVLEIIYLLFFRRKESEFLR